jgi:hypothetical protein
VPRVPLRLCLVALAALACAGPPPLPEGVPATPALGDSLALLVTKLQHAEGAPAEVELRELRVLSVDAEPWRTLPLDEAEGLRGEVGVIAGRRCRFRERILESEATERGSWYLLRGGALVAFDHRGFAARCASRGDYEPVGAERVALERSLLRYLSQRWPKSEIAPEERLARGLRLLERGRPEDAAHELHALDRRIDELSRRQTEYETPDEAERARLREEEERLRPMRAQLYRTLRDRTEGETP